MAAALPVAALVAQAHRGEMRGVVLDSAGAPVPGARVVPEGKTSVAADSDGRFSWTGLAPGEYQIIVTATGFTSYKSEVRLRAGKEEAGPGTDLWDRLRMPLPKKLE